MGNLQTTGCATVRRGCSTKDLDMHGINYTIYKTNKQKESNKKLFFFSRFAKFPRQMEGGVFGVAKR